jgi:hypothetical protein
MVFCDIVTKSDNIDLTKKFMENMQDNTPASDNHAINIGFKELAQFFHLPINQYVILRRMRTNTTFLEFLNNWEFVLLCSRKFAEKMAFQGGLIAR